MTHKRRIGLLGGTFDPVHVAHLHIAACALQELGLSEVRFVPAGTPPHKPGRPISDAADRLRMLELATADADRFTVDPIDLRGDAPAYTSELLERIRDAEPDAELWFIIGADSLAELHTWHRPERIIELARLAVATRPGWDVDDALATSPVAGLRHRVDPFSSVPVDLSATRIRERIGARLPVDWLVPSPVLGYVAERQLYARADETP
jgi:nicotinate-nucleotide adenylyltransferase